jgi:hypothetical protein
MQLLPAAGMASGSHVIMYSRAHRISGSFLVDGSLLNIISRSFSKNNIYGWER